MKRALELHMLAHQKAELKHTVEHEQVDKRMCELEETVAEQMAQLKEELSAQFSAFVQNNTRNLLFVSTTSKVADGLCSR